MKQVLIVEDSFVVARGIQQKLNQMGFSHSTICASKDEVAAWMKTNEAPLFMMIDLELLGQQGNTDGIEIACQYCQQIPCFFMSALTDKQKKRLAIAKARCMGFFTKTEEACQMQWHIENGLEQFKQEAFAVFKTKNLFGLLSSESFLVKEIRYFESTNDCVSLHHIKGKVQLVTTYRIGHIEEFLKKQSYGQYFVRCGKSYIVNKLHAKLKSNGSIEIPATHSQAAVEIQVGNTYSQQVKAHFC